MSLQSDIAIQNSMGHAGHSIVTTTAAQAGNWSGIQVVTATVISSITGAAGCVLSGVYSGTTLPAGLFIPGKFTSFTLISGVVIAYIDRT